MAYAVVKEKHWFWQDMSPFWWFWLAAWRGGSYFKSSSARSIPASSPAGQIVRSWRYTSTWDESEPPTVAWLWSHDRESDSDYAERVMRASWRRYAGYAIDVLTAGVCAGVPMPKTLLPEKWLTNVTLDNQDFQAFRAQVALETSVFGHTWVAGDKKLDGTPYLYTVNPLNLTNWRMGRDRKLEWAIVREKRPPELEPVWRTGKTGESDRPECVYRLWTRNTVELVDHDGKSIEPERVNTYGRVPLEPVFYARDISRHEPCGLSVMEDIADVNLHEYNVRSMRDVILLDTAFPFLAVNVPEGETKLRTTQTIEVATNRWVAFFGSPPVWIQPGPEAITTHTEILREDIDSIRELAGLKTPHEDGAGVVSAEAMRIMRANLDARFTAHGRNLKDGEERYLNMIQGIAGQKPEGAESAYPPDYSMQEDKTRVDTAIAKLDAGLRDTPEAQAEILKQVFRIGMPALEPEQLAKIDKAIEMKATEPPPALPGMPPKPGDPGMPVDKEEVPPPNTMRQQRAPAGRR